MCNEKYWIKIKIKICMWNIWRICMWNLNIQNYTHLWPEKRDRVIRFLSALFMILSHLDSLCVCKCNLPDTVVSFLQRYSHVLKIPQCREHRRVKKRFLYFFQRFFLQSKGEQVVVFLTLFISWFKLIWTQNSWAKTFLYRGSRFFGII